MERGKRGNKGEILREGVKGWRCVGSCGQKRDTYIFCNYFASICF